jgi:hypothetical protein
MPFPARLLAWVTWLWFCLEVEPALVRFALPDRLVDQVFLATMFAYGVVITLMALALGAFALATVLLGATQARGRATKHEGTGALLRGLALAIAHGLGLLALAAAGGMTAGWWALHSGGSLPNALIIGVFAGLGGVVSLVPNGAQLLED